MNKNIEHQYLKLLKDILENGVEKQDRTGTGTISVFGRQIRHKMSEGFPLLTTKKMYWKCIVTELLWFLRGDTNIKYLVDNGCNIWDGDAYKHYLKQFEIDQNNFDAEELAKGHNDQCWGYPILDHVKPTSKEYKRGQINAYLEGKANKPFFYLTKEEFINKIKTDDEFAKKWGELGPIYGKQWRAWENIGIDIQNVSEDRTQWSGECWNEEPIDQIQNLIEQLKTNPDSRRLMVSSWNVGELDQMTLPPCHYGFQVYTRELSLDERIEMSTFWHKDEVRKQLEDSTTGTTEKYVLDKLEKQGIPTRSISLMWNQRSVDTFLGLPFNIASYGLLLEIIAKEVNMVPDELIGNLGDVHLYKNHVEQAKEQLSEIPWEERLEMLTDPSDIREFGNISPFTDKMINYWLDLKNIPYSRRMPFPLPKLGELPDYLCMKDNWECYEPSDFTLENYQSHPSIKAPLSN